MNNKYNLPTTNYSTPCKHEHQRKQSTQDPELAQIKENQPSIKYQRPKTKLLVKTMSFCELSKTAIFVT
jgi:hypothetical protein